MVDDRWVYLTDGGHLDNLGLVEAVRRLPRKVLAMSASNDPPGSWQDVGAAVSVIRADLGIDLRVMDRDRQDAWMRLKADAPYDIDVLVVRAAMTKLEWLTADDPKEEANPVDEPQMPIDSRSFATRDPNFPRASTGRQDFGDLEFESYRRLGQFLVHRALSQNQDFLGATPSRRVDCRGRRSSGRRRRQGEHARPTRQRPAGRRRDVASWPGARMRMATGSTTTTAAAVMTKDQGRPRPVSARAPTPNAPSAVPASKAAFQTALAVGAPAAPARANAMTSVTFCTAP